MTAGQKTIVITGASSGIGKAAARVLAREGNRLILLMRDSEKSRTAMEEIAGEASEGLVEMVPVELASGESVRKAAAEVLERCPQIDVLLNNAGLFRRRLEESADGFEITLAVNFLAPVLLTALLLENLKVPGKARIVNVASELYKQGRLNLSAALPRAYNGMKTYADSKLLLVLYTQALAASVMEFGITANSVHPGVVGTDVFRDYPRWVNAILRLFISTPEKGSRPLVHLATSSEVEEVTGQYFKKRTPRSLHVSPDTEKRAGEVWEFAEKLWAER